MPQFVYKDIYHCTDKFYKRTQFVNYDEFIIELVKKGLSLNQPIKQTAKGMRWSNERMNELYNEMICLFSTEFQFQIPNCRCNSTCSCNFGDLSQCGIYEK